MPRSKQTESDPVDDAPRHQYVILTDRVSELGEVNKRASLPEGPQTQALVDAGHVKPVSDAAKAVTE